MYNKTRSDLAKAQPRDATGKFLPTGKTKFYSQEDMYAAYLAGFQSTPSFQTTRKRFELWLNSKNKLTKL